MKLSRKAIISVVLIILFTTSGLIVYSQFFSKKEIVVLQTTKGNIEIELDREHAPTTVENFLAYVKAGFYKGTVFHRVMSGFVIQGGGYTANGTEKATNAAIKLESSNGLSNTVGTIAMARMTSPNTATSQFFINLVDNSDDLDYASSSNPGYAVFGKVVSGMDVVNAIAGVTVETRQIYLPTYGVSYPFQNWPVEDIIIIDAYVKP
jgi:peptidyl-prolyl cis-trans isomerase A (cyclophilin A)